MCLMNIPKLFSTKKGRVNFKVHLLIRNIFLRQLLKTAKYCVKESVKFVLEGNALAHIMQDLINKK